MRRWLILLTLLVGLAVGVSGTVLAPRLAGPFLPQAIRGSVQSVEGKVVAKRREQERLLLTILTAQGALLATFKTRVAEIDLLVEQGDTVTLALRRYDPFIEDPTIQRVRKGEPAGEPRG